MRTVRVDWFSEGLFTYDGMPWSSCRARKSTRCHVTGNAIKPGDAIYRPVTNNNKRMRRLCTAAISNVRAS